MENLQASDVMTRDVLTVAPETPLGELARLLVWHGLNAMPVVDRDAIAGVVTEGDLLHRPEIGTEDRPAWWLNLLADSASLARRYVKTHGRLVRDVMTTPAVTVADDTPLLAVADLLRAHGIKQVPVTHGRRLVGIVSRSDLVRVLADRFSAAPMSCDDTTIRTLIQERLAAAPWAANAHLNVSVRSGVVEVEGWVRSADERRAVQVMAEAIPGVRSVVDRTLDLNLVSSAM